MALDDIISAISQHADQKIATARSAHQKKLSEMREESERRIAKKKQDIAVQKEEKKGSMKNKAQTHALMLTRNAELQKKQELLDALYSDVISRLTKLSDSETEAILSRLIQSVKGKGSIKPANAHAAILKKIAPEGCTVEEPIDAKGGFIFVSDKQELDCTFEQLVFSQLRPSTEVEAAHTLFDLSA